MKFLTIEFEDSPNSEHAVKGSLSRSRKRAEIVSHQGCNPTAIIVHNLKAVSEIRQIALDSGMHLAWFSEVSGTRGVYQARFEGRPVNEDERLLAAERAYKEHSEARHVGCAFSPYSQAGSLAAARHYAAQY